MDLASGRHSKLRVGLVVVAGVYWLAMFVGTHIPVGATPSHEPNSFDKVEHFTAFAVLAALLCSVGAASGITSRTLFVGVFLLIALYGMLDEATQLLVSHREADVFDWLADMVGAMVGMSVFWFVRRFRVRPGEPNGN